MLQPLQSEAPAVRAARTLRHWIALGHLPVGEPLPSEIPLARRLELSRTSLRAALETLAGEGLVSAANGGARRVLAQPPGSRALSALVALVAPVRPPDVALSAPEADWETQVQNGVMAALGTQGRHAAILDPVRLAADGGPTPLFAQGLGGLVLDNPACRHPAAADWLAAAGAAGVPAAIQADCVAHPGVHHVRSDHEAGSHALTTWLLAQGHRRILRLWTLQRESTPPPWVALRDAGFERAHREGGLPGLPAYTVCTPGWVRHGSGEEFAMHAHLLAGHIFGQLQQQPIDAILVLSDGEVYPAAAALRVLGHDPQRLPVIGYDNYWSTCGERRWESYVPPVSVTKHNRRIGEELVRLVLDADPLAGPQQVVVAPELVQIRG